MKKETYDTLKLLFTKLVDDSSDKAEILDTLRDLETNLQGLSGSFTKALSVIIRTVIRTSVEEYGLCPNCFSDELYDVCISKGTETEPPEFITMCGECGEEIE